MHWSGPAEVNSAQERQILAEFSAQQRPERKDFERLAAYFQNGFAAYKDPSGSTASYPGLPSSHGRRTDSVEGFSRMAPLMAVYLRSHPHQDSQQAAQARQFLIQAWTSGSDPKSEGYWGPIWDNDQRIIEAADIALSIWLLRDSEWASLAQPTRNNMVEWLLQVNHKKTEDNNWHLFVTYVNLAVSSLGYPADMQEAHTHYDRFKTFYRGDGWFSDGPEPKFDYYNSWGIAYQLFWIDQVDANFDHKFIATRLNDFAKNLQYLIGPNGFPITGRSMCYRLAATAPLILAQTLPQPSVPPGAARRALDTTWKYFLAKGAVSGGRVTQGYCGFDERVVDSYSGPASCQWSLRSLISALYLDSSNKFWTSPEQPLPVEQADYSVNFPQPGWTVAGHKPDTIVILTKSTQAGIPLKAESPFMTVVDRITGKVHRPGNDEMKYGLHEYRSDTPFCGCAPAR
jgi:hypothetical protein